MPNSATPFPFNLFLPAPAPANPFDIWLRLMTPGGMPASPFAAFTNPWAGMTTPAAMFGFGPSPGTMMSPAAWMAAWPGMMAAWTFMQPAPRSPFDIWLSLWTRNPWLMAMAPARQDPLSATMTTWANATAAAFSGAYRSAGGHAVGNAHMGAWPTGTRR